MTPPLDVRLTIPTSVADLWSATGASPALEAIPRKMFSVKQIAHRYASSGFAKGQAAGAACRH